jgi:serine/threonine protein kinase
MELQPGALIGSFVLDQRIGDGAFAQVWQAHHTLSSIVVAIKVIEKASISTPIARTRLTREISLLRQMRHPFVTELFQALDDDMNHYLVMEFVEHGNMLDYVNLNGRVNEDQARRFFTQLIWVLEYLHFDRKVAHRDLKCENVLFDRYDNIRLIDFGLSTVFSDLNPQLATACGSPAYAAPEMVKGNQYTKSADIWSAGILLFAVCAGYLPFDDDNMQRLLHKIVYSEQVYPSFMSPALIDLLTKMMCKEPEQRISIEMIKSHPWFSQSEYLTMVQVTQAHIQQWQTGEGQSANSVIDAEVRTKMTQLGIDCHDLHESLLSQGDDTEVTVIYRILIREKLTENMKGLMQKVALGAALGAKQPRQSPFPRLQTPDVGGAPGLTPQSRPVTPGHGLPLRAMPGASAGQKVLGRILVTPGQTSGRRLSRPVAVRKPESFAPGSNASHETP